MYIPMWLVRAPHAAKINEQIQSSLVFSSMERGSPATTIRRFVSREYFDNALERNLIALLLETPDGIRISSTEALDIASEYVAVRSRVSHRMPHWVTGSVGFPKRWYGTATTTDEMPPSRFLAFSGIYLYMTDERVGVAVPPTGFLVQGEVL